MTARALLAAFLVVSISAPLMAARAHLHPLGPAATILCYHIVESPQDPRMEVSRETFHQQIRYLALTGYNVIPLRWAYEYAKGVRESLPKNAVVVTIDDGWRSTYTEVFPEMQKRKFPFTVFIYPKIIGQTAHALTWKQVKEMAAAGVDIESHSLSHPFLTQRRHASLGDKEYQAWLDHELVDSKRILERETGRTVSFLAYPYGDYDHHLAAAVAKAGYAAALTCDYGHVGRGSDLLRMKRFVVDKRMDFAEFRHYLGAGQMRIEEATPIPGTGGRTRASAPHRLCANPQLSAARSRFGRHDNPRRVCDDAVRLRRTRRLDQHGRTRCRERAQGAVPARAGLGHRHQNREARRSQLDLPDP